MRKNQILYNKKIVITIVYKLKPIKKVYQNIFLIFIVFFNEGLA